MNLRQIRGLIDALDEDIVTMLARRLELVDLAADRKDDADLPVFDVERSREVIRKAKRRANLLGTSPIIVERVYGVLVAETGLYQARRRLPR